MILLIVSVLGAATLMRCGVLLKEKRILSPSEWLGHLITGALWGFIGAVAVSHVWQVETLPLVAVAAFVGYMGDKKAFALLRSQVSKLSKVEIPA